MKYLVTGGAGFIGSHLGDVLIAAGHDVVVLDDLSSGKLENINAKAHFTEGCITDEALVAELVSKCHGVFHLAAIPSVTQTMEHWAQTHRINQSGAVNIFEQAAKCGINVVYASSAAVYGDNSDLPLKESAQTKPLSPYGLDKLACEWQANVGAKIHKLKSVGLRFFNVYGPRQDPKSPYSGVISIFAEKLRAKQPLLVFGDGEQTRDFIYVADIVHGLIASMQLCEKSDQLSEVFNLCGGNSISINELAGILSEVAQEKLNIKHLAPRDGDIVHSCGDAKKMQAFLGLKAETSLESGLKLLWQSL